MKKEIEIYYDEHGNVDKIATYVNNHDWVMPVFVIVMFIIVGLVEGM